MSDLTCMRSELWGLQTYVFLKQIKTNITLTLEICIKNNGELNVYKNSIPKNLRNSILFLREAECELCEAKDAYKDISDIWQDLECALEEAIW